MLEKNTNDLLTLVAGIILGMGLANETQRYTVMSSLIGWAHTQNDPWVGIDRLVKTKPKIST